MAITDDIFRMKGAHQRRVKRENKIMRRGNSMTKT